MTTIGVSEARTKLAQLVDQVHDGFERLFITKNGRARAVLISVEEFESWIETIVSYQNSETRKRNKELKTIKQKDLLTLKELKAKLRD